MNYHDRDEVSKTKLGHFLTSTSEYYRYYIAKSDPVPQPKRQMVIGSAIHAMLLEKKSFNDVVAIYPDDCLKSNGAINPVPAGKFVTANPDKFVVKQDDADIIESCCFAVMDHALGDVLVNDDAVFEQPQFWTCSDSGLPCRMMADFFIDMGDEILAYDLKTTESIYPASVRRTAKTMRYWLQDAHYSSGLQHIFKKPVRFVFWFVEVPYPHRVARWEYHQAARETATTAYRQTMERLAECYRSNNWEDDWTQGTNFLQLNPWDVGADEEGEVAYEGDD